jgi:hypothetical protein
MGRPAGRELLGLMWILESILVLNPTQSCPTRLWATGSLPCVSLGGEQACMHACKEGNCSLYWRMRWCACCMCACMCVCVSLQSWWIDARSGLNKGTCVSELARVALGSERQLRYCWLWSSTSREPLKVKAVPTGTTHALLSFRLKTYLKTSEPAFSICG